MNPVSYTHLSDAELNHGDMLREVSPFTPIPEAKPWSVLLEVPPQVLLCLLYTSDTRRQAPAARRRRHPLGEQQRGV